MDRGCENSREWNESRVTVPDAAREEMKSQVNRGPLREARLLERGGFTTDSFHFEDLAIEVAMVGRRSLRDCPTGRKVRREPAA